MVILDTVLIGSIGALVVTKLAILAVVVYWSVRGILDQGNKEGFALKPALIRHKSRTSC
ncbi:MAG TPA: hypothetical protein VIQ03_15925 [Gammaproteobacteria bacterium]